MNKIPEKIHNAAIAMKAFHTKEYEPVYFTPRLDLEKVKTVEDCTIILDFLIRHICPPIDTRLAYNGLDLIKDYLKD